MATVRLYNKEGDYADVPEEHPSFANYKAKYPLTEPPKAKAAKAETATPETPAATQE